MGLQELFESFDKKKRKSHFKNLIAVALADGHLDDAEMELILHLANKCYMTPDEVKRVIERPELINFHPPKTNQERFDQIYDLVTVMLVDGKVDENERELCKMFALNLGYKSAIVDRLIHDIIENALHGVAKEIALHQILNE